MISFKQLPLGKYFLYTVIATGLSLSSCQEQEETEQPSPIVDQPSPAPSNPTECVTRAGADNGNVIEGEYIIKYKTDPSTMSVQAGEDFLEKKNIRRSTVRRLYHDRNEHAVVAKLSSQELTSIKSDPAVEAVEPDRVISIVSCNTDIPDQTDPWGIKRVGNGDGRGKTVWVIDTGVDLDHPDLTVDGARSKSFISGTTADDDHGHGSHVAGTIAAKNNSIGVIGVAHGATVVALKVMDATGKGSTSNVISAVNYVASNAKAGDVVNMSIGGGLSDMLDNAVKTAAGKGILFAIAAGNDKTEVTNSSPGRVNHGNVFTVSAMNSEDTYASFSNFGNGIDYCAPGVNIASTYKNGGFATMSGTSMATPHIAGLLLIKGKNILTNGFVKEDPDGVADPIGHK